MTLPTRLPLLVLLLPFAAFVLLAVVAAAAPRRRARRPPVDRGDGGGVHGRAGRLGRGLPRRGDVSWIPSDGGPIATVGVLVDPLSTRCWCW